MKVYRITHHNGDESYVATLSQAHARVHAEVSTRRHEGLTEDAAMIIAEIEMPRLKRDVVLAILNGEAWTEEAPELVETYRLTAAEDGDLALSMTTQRMFRGDSTQEA